jgi:DNA-binding transcriptional ArsR family regulator
MSSRIVVARELSEIFKLLSHPDRIRLVEELRRGEADVNSLHEALGLPATRVSQHLALLRAQKIVAERRDGRRHLYHLTQPEFARWIVDGLAFIETRAAGAGEARAALESARRLWTADASDNDHEIRNQEGVRR